MATKKLVVVFVTLVGLTCLGCLSSIQTAPSGCEEAAVYKTGFIPLGPVVVRSGLYSLAVLSPESRDVIVEACNLAQGAIEGGRWVEGLRSLAAALAGQSQNDPALKILVFSAINTLDAVLLYPGADELAIGDCDREVLLSLVNNIRADAESLKTQHALAR